jgi:hypothetical protein
MEMKILITALSSLQVGPGQKFRAVTSKVTRR